MSSTAENSSRTSSIVRTLSNAEGRDVVLRFDDTISVPTEKYDGRSYQSDTLPKATLNVTIQHASIEDEGMYLMCFGGVKMEELDRVGIDSSVVYTEPIEGPPERCIVDINASREWWDEETEISMQEVERAIEEGREEEVLPLWDGLPTVTVNVERTEECHKRTYESNFHIQYSSPTHEIGTLIDVRIK
ncbi:hypothetical protein HAPAU_33790 [Halalkalicoccus paucihalophilus]|uniref:Uncharacterized protein n=1 Tax=Halalkalicoccus paucihalophilus TaxID=1008153 RepID=A0A151A9L5_9EURY|nr:hypothetical protein [Halalkalicoccus paucihalophilus]KYH24396.1 hypothetical protein HAPAU_33790 [Halalkalicoccus paucihalophilus]